MSTGNEAVLQRLEELRKDLDPLIWSKDEKGGEEVTLHDKLEDIYIKLQQ